MTLRPEKASTRSSATQLLAAFALWAAAHLLVRGDVAGHIYIGGLLILSALGMVHIDARRRANADDAWRSFEAGTSPRSTAPSWKADVLW